jgi:hypothetical protein
MKTKFYLLMTILMINFWFGMHTVSGNQVISKKDTLVFIHNLVSAKEIPVKNSLYVKVDTTRDDYLFISGKTLANQKEIKTTSFNPYRSVEVVIKIQSVLNDGYYFDPTKYRIIV